MESLSSDCTPLKHRYDSCFNAWFEGYLQPALDASNLAPTGQSAEPQIGSFTNSPPLEPPRTAAVQADARERFRAPPGSNLSPDKAQSTRQTPRPHTNWSAAIGRSSVHRLDSASTGTASSTPTLPENKGPNELDLPVIDTRGKTRAQIKAEQYERACGEKWKAYRLCLERGIAQNQSLSSLLNQAREEHPLVSENGLEGTPWDPNRNPDE